MMRYVFPVESTHVLMFARAVGLDDAPQLAAISGGEAPVAPPTFLRARAHFRPPPDQGRPQVPKLHAEQSFVLHAPIRAGDVLEVEEASGAAWERPRSSGGWLRFEEEVVTYRREGAVVAVERSLGTIRVDEPSGLNHEAPPGGPPATSPGDDADVEEIGSFTRTDIARYAGASGDFASLHVDEAFATQVAGFPSVIAHGMLTMGRSATAVVRGNTDVVAVACRFRRPVLPVDTLRVRHATSPEPWTEVDGHPVAFETVNGRDEVVASGLLVIALR